MVALMGMAIICPISALPLRAKVGGYYLPFMGDSLHLRHDGCGLSSGWKILPRLYYSRRP